MEALILFGPPGSGKGTQAGRLVAHYGLTHLATGDLFREALARRDPVALEAQDLMKAGRLAPDELIGQMVRGRLDRLLGEGRAAGVIFDGYPRNVAQVGRLDAILRERSIGLLGVVALAVDDDLLIRRLAGRRTCPTCGRGYNLYFDPPKVENRCDYDHTELTGRPDDNEATIRERLRVYRDQSQPVLDVYRRRGDLEEVSGEGRAEDVFRELTGIVDRWTNARG